jgi:transcription elongation factor GreA
LRSSPPHADDGVPVTRRCGDDRIVGAAAARDLGRMIDESIAAPARRAPGLTQAEYDRLVEELNELRTRRRTELARRLREARDHGSPGEDGDLLSVLEEVSLDESRIAQLEDLLRLNPIVEVADDGIAAVGCTVRVSDDRGGVQEYRLVGRRGDHADRFDVSPGSPVGTALLGAAQGDTVRVTLPSGRVRELRVVEIGPTPAPQGRRAA